MTLPEPSGEFEWVQAPWGTALQCRPLATVASHYFTTRDLRLEGPETDNLKSWMALAHSLGVELDAFVRLRQIHGAAVSPAVAAADDDEWPEADIVVSDDPLLAISVRAADCVPTLMADRHGRGVAAVHAGWKGTAAGAVMAAVRALLDRFGVEPRHLIAAVGPSIGPCCYEVGHDLLPMFSAQPDGAAWFSQDARPRLDLWRATRDQLRRAGVPGGQIHIARLCTFDLKELFYSYRREGAPAGRLVAAIRNTRAGGGADPRKRTSETGVAELP